MEWKCTYEPPKREQERWRIIQNPHNFIWKRKTRPPLVKYHIIRNGTYWNNMAWWEFPFETFRYKRSIVCGCWMLEILPKWKILMQIGNRWHAHSYLFANMYVLEFHTEDAKFRRKRDLAMELMMVYQEGTKTGKMEKDKELFRRHCANDDFAFTNWRIYYFCRIWLALRFDWHGANERNQAKTFHTKTKTKCKCTVIRSVSLVPIRLLKSLKLILHFNGKQLCLLTVINSFLEWNINALLKILRIWTILYVVQAAVLWAPNKSTVDNSEELSQLSLYQNIVSWIECVCALPGLCDCDPIYYIPALDSHPCFDDTTVTGEQNWKNVLRALFSFYPFPLVG